MTLESWINNREDGLCRALSDTMTPTISHALSVRIQDVGAFTRICVPFVFSSLREEFVFWCTTTYGPTPAGYLVGGKNELRKAQGLWHVRFGDSLYYFILNDKTVNITDPNRKPIAVIHIRPRFLRPDALEITHENVGCLYVNYPLLWHGPFTYMTISNRNRLSFRAMCRCDMHINVAYGSKILSEVYSFRQNPHANQCQGELAALLFHPDDFHVISSICDKWPPSLLTCICVWAKCYGTPRNGYS